jgi:hypothetical protein
MAYDYTNQTNPFGGVVNTPPGSDIKVSTQVDNDTVKVGTGEQSPFQTPTSGLKQNKSSVSSFSTKDAISQLNEDKARLDEISPVGKDFKATATGDYTQAFKGPAGDTVYVKDASQAPADYKAVGGNTTAPATPTETPKATYTNAAGQTFMYSQDELNDPLIQQQIKDGGMVLSNKDAGVNIYGDEANPLQQSADNANKVIEDATNQMLSWNVDTDPEFQATANSIKSKFATMKAEMEKINSQRQASYASSGLRQGTTQFSGDITRGIVGEEISQGSARISEIAAQESAAISAARTAYKTGKWDEFNNTMNALKDIRDQKTKALSDYNTKIADAANQLREDAKFEMEVAKFNQEIASKKADAMKPMVVAPGSSMYDPLTGEFLGQAPEKPANPMDYIKEVDGNLLQYNPDTGGWANIYSKNQAGQNGVSSDAMSWAGLISSGKAKLTDVPSDYRTQVATALNSLPPKPADITKIQNKINTLKNVKDGVGFQLTKAVGTNWLARTKLNPFSWDDRAQKNKLIGTIDQMVGQEALKALSDAKASGATFGALSDAELNLLKDSSTKFGNWARDIDGDGKTDYYDIDEKTFKEELQSTINNYNDLLQKEGGATNPIDDYYQKNPAQRAYIDRLDSMKNPSTGQPYTDEEKAQILGISFNQVGGDTKLATRVATIPTGQKAGQCGRFVNKLTGLGLGDSFQNKMSKMNPMIKQPAPGMVFVMPYKNTGHTGIILSVNNGMATVKDSNWSLDEKVKVHQIPVSKMTGFTYA